MTNTARTIRNLFTAIDTLADELLGGCPSRDPATGERMTFDGELCSTPGFHTASMGCQAVDALAVIFLADGHEMAARVAIADHLEADESDNAHYLHNHRDMDWLDKLAFAEEYLNCLRPRV